MEVRNCDVGLPFSCPRPLPPYTHTRARTHARTHTSTHTFLPTHHLLAFLSSRQVSAPDLRQTLGDLVWDRADRDLVHGSC